MPDEIVKHEKPTSLEIQIDDKRRVGSGLIHAMQNNPEEVGSRLAHIANQRVEKWFTEEVLRQIEELIKHKSALLNAATKTAAELQLTEKRIAAIDDGEFKIGWNGKIEFNDFALRLG